MENLNEIFKFIDKITKEIDEDNYSKIIKEQLSYFEDVESTKKLIIFYELMEKLWVNKDYERYYKLRHIIERYKEVLFS